MRFETMKEPSDSSAEQVKILWREAFGDDEQFIDSFLMRYYPRSRMLCAACDGHLAAMLHLLPFETEMGRSTYIYGVATRPAFRGRGLASQLMHEAMRIIAEQGDDAAFLIPTPGREWLREFYGRFGFTGCVPTAFRSADDFDFGTGSAPNDLSMIWRRDRSTPLPAKVTATFVG